MRFIGKQPKMIQLMGWIFLMTLLSTASSDTTLETGSESLLEASLTTLSQYNESENLTAKIPITSSTETSSTNTDFPSKLDMKAEMNKERENISSVLEVTSGNKPIVMSLKTHMPEPAYLGETTITFQSTSSGLKEFSPEEIQQENPTVSDSDKNLYYDSRTTTEYGKSHEMIAESPDLISDDYTDKSTLSMDLISIKTKKHDGDVTDRDEVDTNDTTFNGEITSDTTRETVADNHQSTETEKDHFSDDGMSQTIPAEFDSKTEHTGSTEIGGIDLNVQNHKTTTKVEGLKLDEKQIEDLAFEESSRTFLEKSTPKTEETAFVLIKPTEQSDDASEIFNPSDEALKGIEISTDKEHFFTDHIITHIYNVENMSGEATETTINATRNAKRIQGGEEKYPERRIRPVHPDPGYARRPEIDRVRPYRPDSPLHKYPYHRPTSESVTTRTPRPEYEYKRVTFRPNYSYSKTSQHETSSPKPSSTSDSSASKPYRPSFSRPYVPQGSFGRPYRPDFHRPASKPVDDYPVTPKTSETKGASSQDFELSEHSKADFDSTRQSESAPGYTKTYPSDVRSPVKTDLGKPYRPTYDAEISMHSKPLSAENSENRDSVKVSKPDVANTRPSSFYPRPGYGNNYQTSDTPIRPFSSGSITSAKNLTRVQFIKADCFDNHMKVTMRFNGTFNGLVYSSGYAQDSSCSYVNGSGRNHYEFYIRLNRCGTLGQQEVSEQRLSSSSRRRQERAQYLVNTVTVQYNPLIEEDVDEHYRVTCEYGYDFWKTVTFPLISIESSAVKVREGNPIVFTLPPPQCNMEIRSGYGPSGTRVSGPVNVGDPLTLVIHMKSESSGFDILISNCYAHNGGQKRLQLIDSNGCVVQDKIVSPFRGVSSPDRSQQLTLYSYLKAFRFTGSPALYIECDVHMCHGSCPPQRCYWRHLYKRSAEEMTTEATTTQDSLISESVSLFQALEVRHEEADSQNMFGPRNFYNMDTNEMICLKTGGFAVILAFLLLLLVLSTFAAICMCNRMKKMKKLMQGPDVRHFVEFGGHVPLK